MVTQPAEGEADFGEPQGTNVPSPDIDVFPDLEAVPEETFSSMMENAANERSMSGTPRASKSYITEPSTSRPSCRYPLRPRSRSERAANESV